MDETISLIDAVIEEHKQLMEDIQASEHVANDLAATLELDRAADDFEPASLDRNQASMQSLQRSLEKVDKGLQAHFSREETALLTTFEDRGGRALASALRALIVEHQGLKDRISKSKQQVAELLSGEMSRSVWEPMAYGLRAHIRHTRRLLEAHAQSEHELLQELRKE